MDQGIVKSVVSIESDVKGFPGGFFPGVTAARTRHHFPRNNKSIFSQHRQLLTNLFLGSCKFHDDKEFEQPERPLEELKAIKLNMLHHN